VPPTADMASSWSRLKGTFASRSQTASSKGFQRFGARSSSNSRRAKPRLDSRSPGLEGRICVVRKTSAKFEERGRTAARSRGSRPLD
jgi:hypothetical protein